MATTSSNQILTSPNQSLTISEDAFASLHSEYIKNLYFSSLHKNQFHTKVQISNKKIFLQNKHALEQFKKQVGIKNKKVWSIYQNQIDFDCCEVFKPKINIKQSLFNNQNNFDHAGLEPPLTNNCQYFGFKRSFVQYRTRFANKTIHQHPKFKLKRIFQITPKGKINSRKLFHKDIVTIQAIQQFLIKGSTYNLKKQRLEKEVEPFINFISKFLIINRNQRHKHFYDKLGKNLRPEFLSKADLESSYQFIRNFSFIEIKQKFKIRYQQYSKRQIIIRLNKLRDLEKQLNILSQTITYDTDRCTQLYLEIVWMIAEIGVKLYLKGYLYRAFKIFQKGTSLCLKFKQKQKESHTINRNSQQKFIFNQWCLFSKQLSLFFLYFQGFLLLISAQFTQQNIFKVKSEIDDFLNNETNLIFDSKKSKDYLILAYLQMIKGFGVQFELPQLLIQVTEREENLWKRISNHTQRQVDRSNAQSQTIKQTYPFQNTYYCMKFQCFKQFIQERKIFNRKTNFISLHLIKKCLSYLANLLVNNRREKINDINLNFSLINELLTGLYTMSCWYYNDEILSMIIRNAIICVMCLRIKFKSKEIRDQLVYIMNLLDIQHIFPQNLQNYEIPDQVQNYEMAHDKQVLNASIFQQTWSQENNKKSYQLLLKILYLTARLMFKKNLYFKCFIILDFYCHLVKKQKIQKQVTGFFNQNHQSMLCQRIMFQLLTKHDHRNIFNHVPYESKFEAMETFIIRTMRREALDGANRRRRSIQKTIVLYDDIFYLKDLKKWHILLKSCNFLLSLQKIFKTPTKYRINHRTRLEQMLKDQTFHTLFHQVSKALKYLKHLTKNPQQIQTQSLFRKLFDTFQNRQKIILKDLRIVQQQHRQKREVTEKWRVKITNIGYKQRTKNAREYY